MPRTPTYKKPPVREAVIDIRIERLPGTVLSKLDQLHGKLIQQYPGKKTAYAWEGHWEMRETTIVSSQKSHGPVGYHFTSADEKQILQFRLDGYAFHRLKPDPEGSWAGWDRIREDARAAWELYVRETSPQEITRLAVRYINQIVIRATSVELNDYFTAAPQIPKKFRYQDLENFFSRVAIPIKDLNATAVVTHAPSPRTFPNTVTVILDIEIFRQQKTPIDTAMIWETLDRFRDIKNNVFEESLRAEAKKLFK
jgi:uncharacterized protein (TIGR04255 family)